ncbi:MAG: ISKra4-like element ISDesp4 family transposase, partial [Limisphaerales bacterium]
MVPEELKGRRGKQTDGTAKTRQVYLGCVFTQHQVDEEGHPVRDYGSTTYVSSFKTIAQFGPLLRREASRRGLGSAGTVVLLIDGAAGLENMGKDCFINCVQIVDFYHALEHAALVL